MQRIPQVWPGWQADELIGQGSYGKVYRASRTVAGHTSAAAIKVIDIPQGEEEVRHLRAMGYDAVSVRACFEETARSVIREVAVMESLKGAPNVVDIDDYQLLEREGGVGWTVLIRMELLEPLEARIERDGAPDPREAAAIGSDVCQALGFCHAAGVVHRDVKPANVFVGRFGDYKLGDFGLSRRLDEGSRSTKSRAGTDSFMAPEVLGGHYDARVDVYSLGVMLYCWLNGGRPPFVGAGEAPTRAVLDSAQLRRISGERPPAPAGEGVDPALAGIVLRAVEPDPDDRWQGAEEFGAALRSWLDGEVPGPEPGPPPVPMPQLEPEPAPSPEPAPAPARGEDARAEVALSASEARVGAVREVSYSLASGGCASAEVEVPAGTADGAALRIPGLGGPGSGGGPAGDLVVTVRVMPGPEPAPEPVSEPDRGLAPGGSGSAAGTEEESEQRPLPVLSRRAALALAGCAIAAGALWALAPSAGSAGEGKGTVSDGGGAVEQSSAPEAETVEPEEAEDAAGPDSLSLTQESAASYAGSVSAGYNHTVGLLSDGTVVAVGDNEYGQCDVSGWSDVVAVAAGDDHTVGLLSDGTVVAVGDNEYGQCDVSGWKDVVAVAAGDDHTVDLLFDGTAFATGRNDCGQCDFLGRRDVVAVAAGRFHTVGLLSDGTVVARGSNGISGRCHVGVWEGVVAVAAGIEHTVGLLSDGTVVATGWNGDGQCDVSGWRDVVAVAARGDHTVGLLSDGTVVAVGDNEYGQCDVSGWSGVRVAR